MAGNEVMVSSDLHCNGKVCKGVDESKAQGWLLDIVDCHRPHLLISLVAGVVLLQNCIRDMMWQRSF